MDTIRLGLLGCGVVGTGTIQTLLSLGSDLDARVGAHVVVTRVAVRDLTKDRGLPASVIVTDDARSVATADDVDIVVEVMGGIDDAGMLVEAALQAGKPVVTANKALIAERGALLHAIAIATGADLLYEAAVAGAIPIVRPLRTSLAGDRIRRVAGILNGTTNYILTKMTQDGAAYETVLRDAQALGYAEADPSADVDGHDAAAKAAILAGIAFDTVVVASDVFREGISGVTSRDIEVAEQLGYVIKLLGIATDEGGEIAVHVHPTFLPAEHPLARVDDAFNAIYVEAEAAGELMFYGRGAGSLPTASAIVGDIVEAASNLVRGTTAPEISRHADRPMRPMESISTQYYVRIDVADEPGVLAEVARTFGGHDVSIAQVLQDETPHGMELVIVTHRALEASLQSTVVSLASVDGVHAVCSVIRVESEVGA
ncbi:MAG: homoserine dehydrogenase [Nitriliruptoraceae bacterium]